MIKKLTCYHCGYRDISDNFTMKFEEVTEKMKDIKAKFTCPKCLKEI